VAKQPSQSAIADKPIRVGVFSTIEEADRAVRRLLDAGYTKEQITVISSDRKKEEFFREFEHQEPSGTYTLSAVSTGGAIGAALGGLATLAGVAATGGVGLLAAGGVAAWAGGIVGGLIGAMMTRGVEKELANYYDQAVVQGKLLVAAEIDHQHPGPPLECAEKILRELGAEAVSLPEG
jgi:hypothetical protein